MIMNTITADEVAKILKVTPERVYELCRQRLIPYVRLGRQIRFEEEQLRNWLSSGGTALSGGWRLAKGDK